MLRDPPHALEGDNAMAARPSVDHDIVGWMRGRLERASPDLLPEVQMFAEALMGADTEAVCNAGTGSEALTA
jgi:hypothetical protein